MGRGRCNPHSNTNITMSSDYCKFNMTSGSFRQWKTRPIARYAGCTQLSLPSLSPGRYFFAQPRDTPVHLAFDLTNS